MAKYLMFKHYRGAPEPSTTSRWTGGPGRGRSPLPVHGRLRQQAGGHAASSSTARRWHPTGSGSAPTERAAPATDGPFAETKDLIAGWMMIDVDSYERAVELAGELSSAPGAGGEPIHEWLELRPLMSEPPTVTE